MDYIRNICKLADKYEQIAFAAEEETAARVPHPFEHTLPSESPGELQTQQEMVDFEYIPGYDNFAEALSHLRTASGFVDAIKPQTYRIFAVNKLIIDASRRIDAGMKQVYKAVPADKLQATR